jgi:IS5 family transposase
MDQFASVRGEAGYRGHNAPPDYKFKATPLCHQPVIGHTKNEHRMDRNYLAGRNGDANNAILAAVGYNFRRLIKWLRILLCLILGLLFPQSKPMPA